MSDLGTALTALGLIASLSVFVLNLRVNGAVSDVKVALSATRAEFQTDISAVKLQVEKLRGDFFQEQTKLYQQVMESGAVRFMSREMSLEMHGANIKRLDGIDRRLDEMNIRIGDIS